MYTRIKSMRHEEKEEKSGVLSGAVVMTHVIMNRLRCVR